ncbi:hypothetical protein SDRG_12051 [Saprolegnia diclina VS20]|uniref:RING-type domain-containing protein n=1 Tax=Saprolegnia diclina (strain VS20) TaxID=1156394 RepID=T0PXD9_SAPDV|nr:hypothetical protein SDRG_12051 [Saprolegnia diclina VS20]EQC30199.1 hypothetical protein SDRG_12051 [Saprolegnia diclina VS20]|eukprot:XP_008616331.1 hypothetical protein SDRG_12051 [Saprolegnia diclina VS20]
MATSGRLQVPTDAFAEAEVETELVLKTWRSFAIYRIEVACPITQRWWTLEKRFSDFYRLRHMLEQWASSATPTSAMARPLRRLLDVPFPKREMHCTQPSVVAKRARLLKQFAWALMVFRAECCMYLLECDQTQTAPSERFLRTYGRLEGFLDMPESLREMQFQRAEWPMLSHDPCSICLDEFQPGDLKEICCVVKLPCTHCFHRECVLDWLTDMHCCPLCRAATERVSGLYL